MNEQKQKQIEELRVHIKHITNVTRALNYNMKNDNISKVKNMLVDYEVMKEEITSLVETIDFMPLILADHIINFNDEIKNIVDIEINSDKKKEGETNADIQINRVSRIVLKDGTNNNKLHIQMLLFLIHLPSNEMVLNGDGITRLMRDFDIEVLPYVLALFVNKSLTIDGTEFKEGLLSGLSYISSALRETRKTRQNMLVGALNPRNPKQKPKYDNLVYSRIPEVIGRDLICGADLKYMKMKYSNQIIKNSVTQPLDFNAVVEKIEEARDKAQKYLVSISPYAEMFFSDGDIEELENHFCNTAFEMRTREDEVKGIFKNIKGSILLLTDKEREELKSFL